MEVECYEDQMARCSARSEPRLTEREFEIFVELAKHVRAIDRCCPDVGMGPSDYMCARDAAKRLSFPVSQDDIDLAAVAMRRT